MSLADIGKVCLFSEMSGELTVNGQPAPHVRLVRTAKWQREQRDETVSDHAGRFHFPMMSERTIAAFLPMEFVAHQEIRAFVNDAEVRLWLGIKRVPEANAEARGESLSVTCDLSADEKLITVNGGPILSRCSWAVEPDPSEDWIWDRSGSSNTD